MKDGREDRIGAAVRGENPTVLAGLPASYAVVGDVQWLPGYCVLLADDPAVTRLTDLDPVRRSEYLASMDRLAEAVERACAELDPTFRRVNIEILGNTDPFLHAHVWPRYDWEPAHLVGRPVWLYPPTHWSDSTHALGVQHDELRRRITSYLSEGERPAHRIRTDN